jgi:purine-nucleoside phosphorylase
MKSINSHEFPTADIALIAGSGYAIDKSMMAECGFIPYLQFLPPNADSVFSSEDGGRYYKLHDGRILLVFKKRIHPYQGFSPIDSVLPVRIAKESKVKTIILTNSAGGLNPQIHVGDFVVLRDLLILPSVPDFPDDSSADDIDIQKSPFDSTLSDILHNSVKSICGSAKDGTYAYMPGPAYETRAEVDFLLSLGADVVGMSTAYEALYARESGINVVGLSLVTNVHDSESHEKITHREVLDEASKAKSDFNAIMREFIKTKQGV